jgi:hypothetical protein
VRQVLASAQKSAASAKAKRLSPSKASAALLKLATPRRPRARAHAQNSVGLSEKTYKALFGAVRARLDTPRAQRAVAQVSREISQLRVVLEGAEARERERTWLRQQTHVRSMLA